MVFEVVEFLDPTGEIMVGRLPQQGYGDFTTGSQLIVHENQIAVFYYDGKIADQFTGGRYTLTTQNLPIIKTLSKLVFSGKTPFRTFVNFVNLKTYINMMWGTPQPILFRDKEFKMVNLRARGTFSLRINNHILFLNTIVGTQGLQETDRIQEYLRKIIVSRFTHTLPSILTSVLDLASEYQKVEVKTKQAVREDFGQYGLELVDLIIENITVPPEVQQMIDRAVGMRSFGNEEVEKYQKISVADALRAAGETGGAPEMTAGIGLGAGLAMAQQFVADLKPGQKGAPPDKAGPEAPGLRCLRCNNPIQEEFVVCPICKQRLKRPCVNEGCRKMINAAWDICPFCGTDQPKA